MNWTSAMRALACLVAAAAAGGGACAEQGARGPEFGAGLAIRSDYVFRGISQTLGKGAAQAYLDVELDSGLYGYIWASNVDFVPDGGLDDGASVEINAAMGFATELTECWSVDVMLAGYAFPGANSDTSYDYAEVTATAWYRDQLRAGLAFSANVFGSGRDGLWYGIGVQRALADRLALEIGYGYYDLADAYGADYSHVDVAISRPYAPVTVTLAYHDTFGEARQLFAEQVTGQRYVLSIELDF